MTDTDRGAEAEAETDVVVCVVCCDCGFALIVADNLPPFNIRCAFTICITIFSVGTYFNNSEHKPEKQTQHNSTDNIPMHDTQPKST